MLILDKKNIFSRLAWQILKNLDTKIRKRVPHEMKLVLAKNWPTFYDLVDFFIFGFLKKIACNCAELLGYPNNGFKHTLITTNHILRY